MFSCAISEFQLMFNACKFFALLSGDVTYRCLDDIDCFGRPCRADGATVFHTFFRAGDGMRVFFDYFAVY